MRHGLSMIESLLNACRAPLQGSTAVRFLTRRQNLGALGAFLATLIPAPRLVLADDNAVNRAILQFTQGRIPVKAKVSLSIPNPVIDGDLAEIEVSVVSPMTTESYVADLLILASANRNPIVATLHFSLSSGIAKAKTRIRLVQPADHKQTVTAVARSNDGMYFADYKTVEVTGVGCG